MEFKNTPLVVRETLTQYLLDQKMRRMPERYAILDFAYQQKSIFTADDIFEQMDDVFHVSRATVYSSLDLFVKAGLVVKMHFGSRTYFETCYNQPYHFYQVCTHCGAVKRIAAPNINIAIDSTPKRGFRLENTSLCFHGLCQKCQTRERRAYKKRLLENEEKRRLKEEKKAMSKETKATAKETKAEELKSKHK